MKDDPKEQPYLHPLEAAFAREVNRRQKADHERAELEDAVNRAILQELRQREIERQQNIDAEERKRSEAEQAKRKVQEKPQQHEALQITVPAARADLPTVPNKGGKPKFNSTELGLQLNHQGMNKEDILSKVCPMYPGYDRMSPEEQSKVEERIWKTIKEAERRLSK